MIPKRVVLQICFDLALDDKLKALYIMGENPVVSYSNGKEAVEKAGFVVVQDTFLTETAQMADVVLPSATYAEKGGTFTNMALEVQRLNKVIPPVGESKPDWQIVCKMAAKMGHSFSYLFSSEENVLNEIGNNIPSYAGIDYNNLEKECFSRVSSDNGPEKYKFDLSAVKASSVKKKKDYPFTLLTGPSLNHQGTYSRNSSSLVAVAPDCFVEINRKDAQDVGVKTGDEVVVESASDKLTLKARVTNKSPKGIAFVSEYYEGVPVNRLGTIKDIFMSKFLRHKG